MSDIDNKSPVDPCYMRAHFEGFWESIVGRINMKEQGVSILLVILLLYNLYKLASLQKLWRFAKSWLPLCVKSPSGGEKINALTSDLRMEMRELSEQIIEFQKKSVNQFEEPANSNTILLRQRKQIRFPREILVFGNRLPAPYFNNEITECNWIQYLHKYVYNPNPRILDTGELENLKRAYTNWY